MISFHKKLFYNTFDKNIELYNEFMVILKKDYNTYIKKISETKNIPELRICIHNIIGLLNNFDNFSANEMKYICVNALQIDKNNLIDYETYLPYIEQLKGFDTNKIGI
jgi:hypothetical protein